MNTITLRERLRKKGWEDSDIEQAISVLDDPAKQEKHVVYRKSSQRVLYWMALLVLTACNLLVSLVMVPLFLVLNYLPLYLIIGSIGLIFGLLFNIVIWDIEHLERKHHIFAGFFIPLVSLIDILVIVHFSNSLAALLSLNIPQNPVPIVIVYVGMLVLPYLISFGKQKQLGLFSNL
ncbi:hypothetical protein J4460_07000 [Candidatus Woesearchaeota archaeon]|nr:MAG: hypothetical protein QS99_C0018G0050 [archaeon GW2011_AR4]MBS3130387.1 hypothetical protein [Candidatus Woesearchaeota archaeon]HIH38252.1 hypothetical protein [Candidatus Woesearchaeota archaeon]HIH49099.1 hypothetical protein [Candidatus Woesearchaeota archaeon]HIJ04162.1 hypothetical protein [Candidatus Woesearchaeota archaeon]